MGLVLLTALFSVVFAAVAPPAVAEGEMVETRLRYTDPVSGERVPLEGAHLTVRDDTGATITAGLTDAEGFFRAELPGPGFYGLALDVETLPEGIALTESDRSRVLVEVLPGHTGRAIFKLVNEEELAELADVGRVTFRSVAQLTVEGLKFGVFLAMAAIGLSLIFGTTGLINFAHGEMIGWGMLWAYLFNFFGLVGVFGFMSGWPPPFGAGVNLVFAAILAVGMGLLLGWTMDKFIFAPLRRRGVALIAAMIVTIGLSILLRYVYLFTFGGVPRFYRDFTAQTAMQIGPIEITPKDLITGLLSVAILIGVGLFIQKTRMGKAMRAVSDDRDLAESSGIDVQKVIRFVWVAGAGLATMGGVFIGLSEQVSWNIGFRILLLIFAAVILGGLGTAYGALVGALIVGVGIQVSTLWIPPELKNVGALALLIGVLLLRPQGILGRAERVG